MKVTSDSRAKLTLPSDEQILIERDFEAPKHLVYQAYTTPELVERWWHANRGEVTLVEIDLRIGGRWRYVMMTADGTEVAFHGEYREIVPNERIVSTEFYEGVPEGVSEDDATTLNTATFNETDGRTTLTLLIEAKSKVSRDAIIDSGLEAGLQDALDLLEQTAMSYR
ncbi:MAG: SRPBCC family protein [Solirubrobacterales bacterium]|nr:SRPBCC family protein [Solirubrobacterales bacterium]